MIKSRLVNSLFRRNQSSFQLSFPCIDRTEERERKLQSGPEPNYENLVQGFQLSHHKERLDLIHGGVLDEFHIAYESWGTMNKAKSNVILLHTGLSASSHAKSHPQNTNPGWWEKFIGPGTNKFHIICTNVLGGCYGSTGPSSIKDGKSRFATSFPILTIFDMVRAQFKMLDQMGITRLHASVGASMGGMQSLAAAVLFPERVGRLVSISACARSHPYSIALRFAQRQVLMSDPNWAKGDYYNGVLPHSGMKIATITYRSGPEWEERFGRIRQDPKQTPAFCADYLIESYLDHQGEKFCLTFDPNSVLYISKAMDMFDMSFPIPSPSSGDAQDQDPSDTPSKQKDLLVQGMLPIQMPALILGVQSDLLFPIWQQKEIADCLKLAGNNSVTYYELDAKYGHDTFLISENAVGNAVKGHLELAMH